MSADLFAEFGAPPLRKSSTPSNVNTQPVAPPQSTDLLGSFSSPSTYSHQQSLFQPPALVPSKSLDDTDDWGDFEGPASPEPPAPAKQDFLSLDHPPKQPHVQEPSQIRRPKDPNVLFDATEVDDGDEFGEFEASDDPWTRPASEADQDRLPNVPQQHVSIVNESHKKNTASISSFASLSKSGNFGTLLPPKKTKESPPAALPKAELTDAWDTFADWEASLPSPAPPQSLYESKESITAQSAPPLIPHDPQPGELPPTNVPPPGVLLSLFLPLFAEAQEKLFKPLAGQTIPMRNRLLAEPATISFLQGYLMLARVAARIIAGRKLRWKRDTHLSQGMKIGPASSRGSSGMKLAGVEKSEAMREEREVLDVVRTWKDQLGRLRHVAAAANSSNPGALGTVPDLQEKMPVRVVKETEGGVRAPKQCMLCGLKRDERVDAVDQAVEDSFGEWWVDQVSMHRSCRNFWQEHKKTLQQR